jgi:peptidoglycan/LPS O-acetylase OafA/YrhL
MTMEIEASERAVRESAGVNLGPPTRNPTIDALRGSAVLAVVLLHLNIRVPFASSEWGQWLPKPLSKLLFWSGYPAVMVFFVISGFLITQNSQARWGDFRRIEIGKFYRLRFARIAPAFVLFAFVQSLLQSARVPGFYDEKPVASLAVTLFYAFTFRLNWLEAQLGYLPGAWDVLWSLCIEEVFYLCFPIVFRTLAVPFRISIVLLGLALVGPFARVSLYSNEMWADHSYLSCMGEIAIGCMAGMLAYRSRPTRAQRVALLACGLGLMSLVLYFRSLVKALGLYRWGLDVTVLSLGSAALILATVRAPGALGRGGGAWLSPLRWVGKHSYEIYLSHLFVLLPAVLVFKRWGTPSLVPLWYGCVLLGCVLLGALIARVYSEPLTKRLRPR